MKKVTVLGWYSRQNIGDESYKIAFPQLFPELDLVFEKQKQADICLLGGGDILSESYVKSALGIHAKHYAFSVSASSAAPFELLKQFDGIVVRDRRSFDLLQQNGVSCHLGADAAFILEPQPTNWIEQKFAAENLDLYEKKVGVVLNAHLNHGREGLLARDLVTLMKVAQDIALAADSTPASFIFFPMSTGSPYDDRFTNGLVASRCKFWKKNLVVYDRLGVQETLNLIAECDVVISTRLHSSIFSVISHRPFIDLVHHDKNLGFLQNCGLEEWGLPYWSLSGEQLKIELNKMLHETAIYSDRLTAVHEQQITRLQESLQYVCVRVP